MKKIDAHFHVNFHGFSAEKIVKYLDERNIEKCWLLSWEEQSPPIPSLYRHLPVEEVMSAYEQYPDRFVPFYAPDPGSQSIKESMEQYIRRGVKGCGELKVTYRWKDAEMERYLALISELGIPLLFHMEAPRQHYVRLSDAKYEKILSALFNGVLNGVAKYYLTHLARFIPFASKRIEKGQHYFPGYLYDFVHLEHNLKKYPQMKFIGHGPFFWNNISERQSEKYVHQKGKIKAWGVIDRLLEENDNFYCDISGKSGYNALTRDSKQAKVFVEKHHEKLLFGTDNTTYNFDALLASFRLSKEKLADIYSRNAEKIVP